MRRPLCMDEDDYRGWQEANDRIVTLGARATTPCRDCTAEFAREMRAEDRCDGEPGPYTGRAVEYPGDLDALLAIRSEYGPRGLPADLALALRRARDRARGPRRRVTA